MAEYTQTTTYDKSMQDKIRMFNNTKTKTFVENFNTLIDAEFTTVSAGAVAYTFTPATWKKAVNEALVDLNNETARQCFSKFGDLLSVEFVDIAATGMAYTKNTTARKMRECFYSAPNTLQRELIFEMIALIDTELDLIVAAS